MRKGVPGSDASFVSHLVSFSLCKPQSSSHVMHLRKLQYQEVSGWNINRVPGQEESLNAVSIS